jgi:uncharacterized protein DUF1963
MVRKATIQFEEATSPCAEPVTKFGGQPFWLCEPQWPLSRSTGRPMQFICQIVLDPEIFPNAKGKMAYLFIADDSEGYVDETGKPGGGENAVIIQPGKTTLPVSNQSTGPTLDKLVQKEGQYGPVPVPCEFLVRLEHGEDSEFVPEGDRWRLGEDERARLPNRMDENKIGGTPVFMPGEELPSGGPWRLLLQLDSCSVPFLLNFGDAGIGFAFINEEGTKGIFLWQETSDVPPLWQISLRSLFILISISAVLLGFGAITGYLWLALSLVFGVPLLLTVPVAVALIWRRFRHPHGKRPSRRPR